MSDIEYFYSAHSAFAYLGSSRFMEIAKAAGRKIVHKPYDLTKGIEGVGSMPTGQRPQNHRAYYFGREIQRWAEERNLPMITNGMPTHHYNDTTLSNCMLIAAVRLGLNVDELAHTFLQAHWCDDADLADEQTLDRLAREIDIDPEPLLTAALTQDVQDTYQANTEEAIRRSVFGSPTYFVDGDMFYGQDRLEMVERALRQPYQGSWSN